MSDLSRATKSVLAASRVCVWFLHAKMNLAVPSTSDISTANLSLICFSRMPWPPGWFWMTFWFFSLKLSLFLAAIWKLVKFLAYSVGSESSGGVFLLVPRRNISVEINTSAPSRFCSLFNGHSNRLYCGFPHSNPCLTPWCEHSLTSGDELKFPSAV